MKVQQNLLQHREYLYDLSAKNGTTAIFLVHLIHAAAHAAPALQTDNGIKFYNRQQDRLAFTPFLRESARTGWPENTNHSSNSAIEPPVQKTQEESHR